MKLEDIDTQVVADCVRKLRSHGTFRTKDVSEAAEVCVAHASFVREQSYHALIGKYLSANRVNLGIVLGQESRDARGALWHVQRL